MLDCLTHEYLRGGLIQTKRFEILHNYIPISMEELSKDIYNFLHEWENEDLTLKSPEETEDVLGVVEGRMTVC